MPVTTRSRAALPFLLLALACAGSLPPAQAALSASREIAQAVSDSYTEWFIAEFDAADAHGDADRLTTLEAVDRRFGELMAAYRAAASVTYLAIKRGKPTPPELRGALMALVAFLSEQGAPVPEEALRWLG